MKLIKIFFFSPWIQTRKRRFEIGHNLIKLLQPFFLYLHNGFVCMLKGKQRRLPQIKVTATLHLRPTNEWF
jgi:hypothetical protein